MQVLVIVGSGDRNSHSLHLGQAMGTSLENKTAAVTLVNLIELGLPLFDRAVDRAGEFDAKTSHFLEQVEAADALIYVTPIYHNSFAVP